ncbi:MAG: hypothetical protein WDO69_01240 [Pseudomonadota bacterium]
MGQPDRQGHEVIPQCGSLGFGRHQLDRHRNAAIAFAETLIADGAAASIRAHAGDCPLRCVPFSHSAPSLYVAPLKHLEVIEVPKRTGAQPAPSTTTHTGPLPDALQAELETLVRADSVICKLLSTLSMHNTRAAIFGGWVRDGIRRASGSFAGAARDVDIVVDGPAVASLRRLLGTEARENIFGGFSLATETTHLDIWPLAKTYLIERQALPVQFEVLPQTTVFRINSVVFLPAQFDCGPMIYERGCLDALANRVISFQAEEIPLPQLQAARAVMYAARFNFGIDEEVVEMVRATCADSAALATVRAGLRTYCPGDHLAAAMDILDATLRSRVRGGNGQ